MNCVSHAKSWLIGKDSDAGSDWGQEEKGTTEDEMAGWHHWLNGRESQWTLGVGDGQGGLACCDSWGRKESDTTERLILSDLIWRSFWRSEITFKWHFLHSLQIITQLYIYTCIVNISYLFPQSSTISHFSKRGMGIGRESTSSLASPFQTLSWVVYIPRLNFLILPPN